MFLFMKSDEREMLRIAPRKAFFRVAAAVKSKSLFGSNWYQTSFPEVLVRFKKIYTSYVYYDEIFNNR